MSINEMEARKLVEYYISKQDLRGYKYEFVKVNFDERRPEEYGVVFDIYTPENSLIDGPAVFIVNKNSRDVRVL